ncbi:hypothetical protein CEXT_134491 [Caerostris extrusa]|uniref:Uncharacterized protein n=1 Tax=Caerostris extrusa TaxID=172846 RepID=A0AAV4SJM6_CAEEX|nr:hypothetical protein CEXT_134491 [Caerostris extrusa]
MKQETIVVVRPTELMMHVYRKENGEVQLEGCEGNSSNCIGGSKNKIRNCGFKRHDPSITYCRMATLPEMSVWFKGEDYLKALGRMVVRNNWGNFTQKVPKN